MHRRFVSKQKKKLLSTCCFYFLDTKLEALDKMTFRISKNHIDLSFKII
jgi:hypothetical protein